MKGYLHKEGLLDPDVSSQLREVILRNWDLARQRLSRGRRLRR